MREYLVRFRSCDPFWAAEREHIKDFTPVWGSIPWLESVTEKLHTDEAQARDQYETLTQWWDSKTQPVCDVELLVREPPTWVPCETRGER